MLFRENDLTCIKMIDFGLSKDFSEQNTMTTMSGSPYYIAPEVFLQKYTQKIDIWSMGVVLYIMLSGKVPFPGRTEPEIIHNVIKGVYHFNHPAFVNVSDECKDLINNCLVKDSENRYTSSKALQHSWMSRADQAMTSGTIGDGLLQPEIIEGIEEVNKASKIKNAAL